METGNRLTLVLVILLSGFFATLAFYLAMRHADNVAAFVGLAGTAIGVITPSALKQADPKKPGEEEPAHDVQP